MGKALFLPCLCPAMLVIDLAAFNCDVEGRTAHPRLVCNGTSPALFLCEYLKFTKSYPKSQHDLVSTLKVAGCRNCPGPVPFPQGREKNKGTYRPCLDPVCILYLYLSALVIRSTRHTSCALRYESISKFDAEAIRVAVLTCACASSYKRKTKKFPRGQHR